MNCLTIVSDFVPLDLDVGWMRTIIWAAPECLKEQHQTLGSLRMKSIHSIGKFPVQQQVCNNCKLLIAFKVHGVSGKNPDRFVLTLATPALESQTKSQT